MDKQYMIKKDCRKRENKDAPWLLNYKYSGVKEFMDDGRLREVFTCVWGSRQQDARVFKNEDEARRMASSIGNCIVVAFRKGDPT